MSNDESSVPRLSTKVFLQDVADELFSLDRGVPYTLWQLLARPGPTIRRCIVRRDARLTRPFRLVLISLAVAAIATSLLDIGGQVAQAAEAGSDATEATSAVSWAMTQVFAKFDSVLVLCWVPVVAAGVQAAYRKHALNHAEGFAFGLYTLPQMLIWLALLTLLAQGLPMLAGWAIPLAIFGPVLVAAHGYFRPESESVWRAIGCAVYASFSLSVLMMAAIMLLTLWRMYGP